MKIKTPYLIALVISALIVLWFVIGSRVSNTPKPSENPAAKTETILPSVVIKKLTAMNHDSFIKLYGRTEADREVSVKAETAGLVVKAPVIEGSFVKRGTLICAQDIDARQALVDQAKANLRSRELEYQAAQTLVEKGYRSSTQAASALAALDGAKAQVKQAEIELGNVNMRAPFAGIFEKQLAEIGDYLAPGQPCGLLVDLDPLVIVGQVTESQVSLLGIGKSATVNLATGEALAGKIRFVESRANPATRTFRVEVAVPNKDGNLKSGVTASLKFSVGQTQAHFIPSRILTLDDTGNIGVRYLDRDNIVHFTRVTTIDEASNGIWVTGLPQNTNLIVQGQDYVAEGIKVSTQFDAPTGYGTD